MDKNVLGARNVSQTNARKVSYGKHLVVADTKIEIAKKLPEIYTMQAMKLQLSRWPQFQRLSFKYNQQHGDIAGLVCGTGVSPSQASLLKEKLIWFFSTYEVWWSY